MVSRVLPDTGPYSGRTLLTEGFIDDSAHVTVRNAGCTACRDTGADGRGRGKRAIPPNHG